MPSISQDALESMNPKEAQEKNDSVIAQVGSTNLTSFVSQEKADEKVGEKPDEKATEHKDNVAAAEPEKEPTEKEKKEAELKKISDEKRTAVIDAIRDNVLQNMKRVNSQSLNGRHKMSDAHRQKSREIIKILDSRKKIVREQRKLNLELDYLSRQDLTKDAFESEMKEYLTKIKTGFSKAAADKRAEAEKYKAQAEQDKAQVEQDKAQAAQEPWEKARQWHADRERQRAEVLKQYARLKATKKAPKAESEIEKASKEAEAQKKAAKADVDALESSAEAKKLNEEKDKETALSQGDVETEQIGSVVSPKANEKPDTTLEEKSLPKVVQEPSPEDKTSLEGNSEPVSEEIPQVIVQASESEAIPKEEKTEAGTSKEKPQVVEQVAETEVVPEEGKEQSGVPKEELQSVEQVAETGAIPEEDAKKAAVPEDEAQAKEKNGTGEEEEIDVEDWDPDLMNTAFILEDGEKPEDLGKKKVSSPKKNAPAEEKNGTDEEEEIDVEDWDPDLMNTAFILEDGEKPEDLGKKKVSSPKKNAPAKEKNDTGTNGGVKARGRKKISSPKKKSLFKRKKSNDEEDGIELEVLGQQIAPEDPLDSLKSLSQDISKIEGVHSDVKNQLESDIAAFEELYNKVTPGKNPKFSTIRKAANQRSYKKNVSALDDNKAEIQTIIENWKILSEDYRAKKVSDYEEKYDDLARSWYELTHQYSVARLGPDATEEDVLNALEKRSIPEDAAKKIEDYTGLFDKDGIDLLLNQLPNNPYAFYNTEQIPKKNGASPDSPPSEYPYSVIHDKITMYSAPDKYGYRQKYLFDRSFMGEDAGSEGPKNPQSRRKLRHRNASKKAIASDSIRYAEQARLTSDAIDEYGDFKYSEFNQSTLDELTRRYGIDIHDLDKYKKTDRIEKNEQLSTAIHNSIFFKHINSLSIRFYSTYTDFEPEAKETEPEEKAVQKETDTEAKPGSEEVGTEAKPGPRETGAEAKPGPKGADTEEKQAKEIAQVPKNEPEKGKKKDTAPQEAPKTDEKKESAQNPEGSEASEEKPVPKEVEKKAVSQQEASNAGEKKEPVQKPKEGEASEGKPVPEEPEKKEGAPQEASKTDEEKAVKQKPSQNNYFELAPGLHAFAEWAKDKLSLDQNQFMTSLSSLLGNESYSTYPYFDYVLNRDIGIPDKSYLPDLTKIFMTIDYYELSRHASTPEDTNLAQSMAQVLFADLKEEELKKAKLNDLFEHVKLSKGASWRTLLKNLSSVTFISS